MINVQAGYDNPESGVSVTMLYNAFGPRITDVGQSGIPDTYELPSGVSRATVVRLLGNAVPRELGRRVLRAVREAA